MLASTTRAAPQSAVASAATRTWMPLRGAQGAEAVASAATRTWMPVHGAQGAEAAAEAAGTRRVRRRGRAEPPASLGPLLWGQGVAAAARASSARCAAAAERGTWGQAPARRYHCRCRHLQETACLGAHSSPPRPSHAARAHAASQPSGRGQRRRPCAGAGAAAAPPLVTSSGGALRARRSRRPRPRRRQRRALPS